MAAVDSFALLYREIARSWHDSCNSCVETLAVVGALYTASRAVILARDCYTLIRVHFLPRLMPGSQRLSHRYGQWAVIYGASEAIARAYASELARQGVSIVLVVRDASDVGDAAAISRAHGVETLLVAADFARGPAASKPVREALAGKDIGFLVTCADEGPVAEGGEGPQGLAELSEERLWEVVNRNVIACTLMTRLVVPGMVERGRGALVHIAPGARRSGRPSPCRAALTAASTAFLDSFSSALHQEYGGRGVFVQSLAPYGVASSGGPRGAGAGGGGGWLVPRPEVYARHAVSTLGVARRTTGYWPHTLQRGLVQCIPDWIWALGSRIPLGSS